MEEKFKVLILEDVQFDVELIEYELRREGINFASKQVQTEEEFIKEIYDFKTDIILADHSLPKFDGVSALEIAKKIAPEVPFIFVSGKIGDEFAVEMLKKGATDYVFKNNLTKLVPAIKRALTERDELAELKRSKNQLQKALKEKEMLLKEIHHRVKNNLMIISNLLELQSHYIKDKTDFNFFRESQNRANSMALIHERLYQSTDLKRIDFGNYVRTLAADLFDVYAIAPDQIKLVINAEDIMMDIDTAIPLGLILNELLTNSLKYAFPTAFGCGPANENQQKHSFCGPKTQGFEGFADPANYAHGPENKNQQKHDFCGPKTNENTVSLGFEGFSDPAAYSHGPENKTYIITVKFSKIDDKFILIIKDNGIGFPQDLDYKKTGTLGLELVNRLTRQIDGIIELDTSDGTEFKITFKELEISGGI